MLDAYEAKRKSQDVLARRYSKVTEMTDKAIREAIEKGSMSVSVIVSLPDEANYLVTLYRRMHYSVTQNSYAQYNERTFTVNIDWRDAE